MTSRPVTFRIEQSQGHLLINALRQETGWVLVLEERPLAQAPARWRALGLAQREIEVLHWVVQGKTNPEIGTILGISRRTVQKHLERIYTKLGVENRHAATALVLETTRQGYSENR